ncbi:MAG: tyrosine-type recombinase/integrase [Gammaproteobacteria bacterium]|nr:tyrosine-type recombinase/integrase [Gammaproteobacteria bacterium]
MKKPTTLSARFCETVRQPGRYGDGRGGHGLILNVHKATNGRITRSWIQRITINGLITHLGLGAFPFVGLAEARKMALENMMIVKSGRNPRAGIPTFAEAAEIVIGIYAASWRDQRTEKQWRSSLRTYVMPKLAQKKINKITTHDVMSVLLPHWQTKRETMNRVRNRISAVAKWAIAEGHRTDDPAGPALTAALPKNSTPRKRHAALHFSEVAAAIEKVRGYEGYLILPYLFEFLVLTAARSGEVRGATWDEIDLDNAVWTVPAERMKSGREHRVPLCKRALAVLIGVSLYVGKSGLVFPSPTGKVLTASRFSDLLRKIEVGAVAHGFRSSFRQWAAERTNHPREVCELALAHVNDNATEAAYQRSDLFDRRRKLMDQWETYLAGEKATLKAIAA